MITRIPDRIALRARRFSSLIILFNKNVGRETGRATEFI